MVSRRTFLSLAAAGAIHAAVRGETPPASPKRLAVVTTLWNYRSHAWHMAERFLHGYPRDGRWHRPALEVVSAYVDQIGADDLSRQRADEFGFEIYPSIAAALRQGGDQLACDGVLLIGEHGNYPLNEYGQKQYPRYEFFKQITEVFRQDGRAVPVFNDKHLSWNFEWAQEMVALSEELKFPFLAGSSLPVTWRMPSIDMPLGAPVEEIVCVGVGPIDIYDFHCLESLQCWAERRAGGETGVVSVQGLRGDAVWKGLASGTWAGGGCDAELFASCLARSQTLQQPATFSHRYPTPEKMREMVQEPIAYRIEYADGLKATMFLMNGLVEDITVAARVRGEKHPLSTLFYLPPNPNVVYSASLMSQAEAMFMTGRAPYPVQRTLLTSGLVAAGMRSLATDQQRLATPHLAVRYQPSRDSHFARS